MPPGNTDSLPPETKLNIVAHLLRENGFPAGTSELTGNAETLDALQIAKKGADAGVPNFALVQVVGCLDRDQLAGWTLTEASEPVVTRDTTPSAAALKAAEAKAAGTTNLRPGQRRRRNQIRRPQRTQGRGARPALRDGRLRGSERHLDQARLVGLQQVIKLARFEKRLTTRNRLPYVQPN